MAATEHPRRRFGLSIDSWGLSKWNAGLVLLALVILLWTVSSFLVNAIFESGEYRKPYFVTYFNSAAFVVYLVPLAGRTFQRKWQAFLTSGAAHDGLSERERFMGEFELNSLEEQQQSKADDKLGTRETVRLAAQFSVLWFMANFLANASLAYTSVATSTVLTSMSSLFTLVLSALVSIEQVSVEKVVTVFVCFIGVIIVTLNPDDLDGAQEPGFSFAWIGNLMALASALMYAVYTVLLKVRVKEHSQINMTHFLGFVGLVNLLFLWPVIAFLNYTGVEQFALPSTSRVWTFVISNAAAAVVSDLCWAFAVLVTSPLVVTVGLSATIPLAMFGDMLFNARSGNILYYIGAFLILATTVRISLHSEVQS